jgi:hypothetical protein
MVTGTALWLHLRKDSTYTCDAWCGWVLWFADTSLINIDTSGVFMNGRHLDCIRNMTKLIQRALFSLSKHVQTYLQEEHIFAR